MALADADYRFLYCDVGCNGRISDGGVFNGCSLNDALREKTANIPDPKPLPGDDRPIPHFIVADEAFPLREDIMKPYPTRGQSKEQRIYGYRLSRARRVIENAFGILANRFHIFMSPIALQPQTVEKIVMACCALHNFLRTEAGSGYSGHLVDREDPETRALIPGTWRQDPLLQQAALPTANNATQRAKALREYLCTYVNSTVGSVPWQWEKC